MTTERPVERGGPTGAEATAAHGPILTDHEKAVAKIGDVLVLVQAHILDRHPGTTVDTIGVVDPKDGFHWTIDHFGIDAEGRPTSITMLTPTSSENPQLFEIEIKRIGDEAPHIKTVHVDVKQGISEGKESDLQVALLAEEKFKSIFGIPTEAVLVQEEPEAVGEESAFERFRREVEAEADADPTGQARADLDKQREYWISERERVLARRTQPTVPAQDSKDEQSSQASGTPIPWDEERLVY